eukprot:Lankesteria_metandrocarpae@DN4679_c0_g1_i4.p1
MSARRRLVLGVALRPSSADRVTSPVSDSEDGQTIRSDGDCSSERAGAVLVSPSLRCAVATERYIKRSGCVEWKVYVCDSSDYVSGGDDGCDNSDRSSHFEGREESLSDMKVIGVAVLPGFPICSCLFGSSGMIRDAKEVWAVSLFLGYSSRVVVSMSDDHNSTAGDSGDVRYAVWNIKVNSGSESSTGIERIGFQEVVNNNYTRDAATFGAVGSVRGVYCMYSDNADKTERYFMAVYNNNEECQSVASSISSSFHRHTTAIHTSAVLCIWDIHINQLHFKDLDFNPLYRTPNDLHKQQLDSLPLADTPSLCSVDCISQKERAEGRALGWLPPAPASDTGLYRPSSEYPDLLLCWSDGIVQAVTLDLTSGLGGGEEVSMRASSFDVGYRGKLPGTVMDGEVLLRAVWLNKHTILVIGGAYRVKKKKKKSTVQLKVNWYCVSIHNSYQSVYYNGTGNATECAGEVLYSIPLSGFSEDSGVELRSVDMWAAAGSVLHTDTAAVPDAVGSTTGTLTGNLKTNLFCENSTDVNCVRINILMNCADVDDTDVAATQMIVTKLLHLPDLSGDPVLLSDCLHKGAANDSIHCADVVLSADALIPPPNTEAMKIIEVIRDTDRLPQRADRSRSIQTNFVNFADKSGKRNKKSAAKLKVPVYTKLDVIVTNLLASGIISPRAVNVLDVVIVLDLQTAITLLIDMDGTSPYFFIELLAEDPSRRRLRYLVDKCGDEVCMRRKSVFAAFKLQACDVDATLVDWDVWSDVVEVAVQWIEVRRVMSGAEIQRMCPAFPTLRGLAVFCRSFIDMASFNDSVKLFGRGRKAIRSLERLCATFVEDWSCLQKQFSVVSTILARTESKSVREDAHQGLVDGPIAAVVAESGTALIETLSF